MVYLETYLLKNACADAALLLLSAKWSGKRIQPVRMLFGVLAGSLGAALAAWQGGSGLAIQVILAVAMVRITFGPSPPRILLSATGELLVCALVALGACSTEMSPVLSGAAAGFGACMISRRMKCPPPRRLKVQIVENGRAMHLEAMVDTGNVARDILTGLPVLLAPAQAEKFLGPSQGTLRIRTAAGEKYLPRFLPEEIWVEGERVDAVVLVAPEGLLEHALLPASLAGGRGERTVA